MKKGGFAESQICAILKEAEGGISVTDVCRKHSLSQASFYKLRSKFGGMDTSLIKRMKELEGGNFSSGFELLLFAFQLF
jgi:putative transposase